jgi:hypothetical protein
MRRVATLAGVIALAASLSACVLVERLLPAAGTTSASVDAEAPVALPGQIEPVHAAAIAQDQAVFWVSSNGCTAKEDLTPVVRSSNEGPIITLRRIKEDRCRESRPDGVEVRWSFQEMGLAPGARVSIENPYQMPAG